ncbi:hypothetical protein TeGR_g4275 [Tetraparma gracilis]|uniref:Uncharacterized protein n=1 Tax=Tetraparma gracilis TaxID=2962635 RepID=A0ABQ6N1D9_9STRA|nr:hypothetical protein TeGR_g4275 [Tetraparma gracilis]
MDPTQPTQDAPIVPLSSRRKSLLVDAVVAAKSFFELCRNFIMESLLVSIVASLVPILSLIFLTRPWLFSIAAEYYGPNSSTPPCFLDAANVTAAPVKGHYAARYFLAPPGPDFVHHSLEVAQVAVCGAGSIVVKALLMFRPRRARACATIAAGIVSALAINNFYVNKRELDHIAGEPTGDASLNELYIVTTFLFAVPGIGVIAAAGAGRSVRQLMLAFALFLGSNLVEFVMYEVLSGAVLPFFFDPSTTAWGHFIVRGPLLMAVFTFLTEAMWQIGKRFVIKLGVAPHDSHILLTSSVVVVPVYARLMQGSAENAGTSAYYEAISTVCEIITMHSLMTGRTPFHQLRTRLKVVWRCCCGGGAKKNKVKPEAKGGEGDEDELTKLRRSFCASAVIMMSIGEATSIITSAAFFFLMRVNPASAGSAKIPYSQTTINLLIMIFGEVILSDVIVAYMSNANKSLYKVNLVKEWHDIKEQPAFLAGTAALAALLSVLAVVSTTKNMCITSRYETQDEWVLTTCPTIPGNITEVGRSGVGEDYVEEWDKFNGN